MDKNSRLITKIKVQQKREDVTQLVELVTHFGHFKPYIELKHKKYVKTNSYVGECFPYTTS
mgnify:CR=1 FL=1